MSVAATPHQVETANGDCHRKLQLDSMQRLTGHEDLSHSGYIYITAPASMAPGASWRRPEGLWEAEYQEICHETVSPRNGCLNKTGTMTISMDMWTWEGECFEGSHPLTKNYRQLLIILLEEGELSSPRDDPNWLSKTKWSALKPYMYK